MIKLMIPAALLLLASCNDGDFVNHTLKVAKNGDCTGKEGEVKMLSNTNGERYEFAQCLPDNFTANDCQVTRRGDTIVVAFPKAAGKKAASYQLTLDVDAKPRYHFIQLGEQLLTVIPTTPY